jgi:hypothetical protein
MVLKHGCSHLYNSLILYGRNASARASPVTLMATGTRRSENLGEQTFGHQINPDNHEDEMSHHILLIGLSILGGSVFLGITAVMIRALKDYREWERRLKESKAGYRRQIDNISRPTDQEAIKRERFSVEADQWKGM